ncbi:MAG: HAMP domain-containing histidine kinase [Ignavibacteriae bacterium]|nr:HAMP domain-containing histidine kinase [Ignavibacteriota bacterium]
MFRNLRLSTKLYFTIPPLLLLAIGTSVYLNNKYQTRRIQEQALETAKTYGNLIRESLVEMMVKNERVDDDYLERLKNIQEIKGLHVHMTLNNLHLREHLQEESRLERLQRREQLAPKLTAEEMEVFRTGEPVWKPLGINFHAIIPFKAETRCQRCHDVPVGHVLGAAEMDISLKGVAETIDANWTRSLVVFFGFTILAITLSIYLYHTLVAKRLKKLIEATKVLGSGNLGSPVSIDSSADEFGELAISFEQMRKHLKETQEKLIHSERLSAIGKMASSIIHDFRTPMSAINLAIDSLEQGREVSKDKAQHLYEVMRDSIHRMVIMAQELLDFSRGETHLEKSEFSVDEFMTLLIRSVQQNLERSRVTLHVENHHKGTAIFDPDRLHRALVNIINNAQDAMPNGGTLHITTGKEDGCLYFSIADTGIGIPPEIKDKIFDAFVTAGKKKGTGLGLAITKRIIDQHGGTIEVESERGKGTRFRVKVPVR